MCLLFFRGNKDVESKGITMYIDQQQYGEHVL